MQSSIVNVAYFKELNGNITAKDTACYCIKYNLFEHIIFPPKLLMTNTTITITYPSFIFYRISLLLRDDTVGYFIKLAYSS